MCCLLYTSSKVLGRSSNKLKRRSVSPLVKTKSKLGRTAKQSGSSDTANLSSSVTFCSNLSHQSQHEHLSLHRRSSLRGHVKRGCPCCTGSPEPTKKKMKDLISQNPSKTDKIVTRASSPSSTSSSSSSSAPSPTSSLKKPQHSKSILKSHISKKR